MTTWYEIIIIGSAKAARAFLAGFEAGSGSGRVVIDASDAGIDTAHHPDSLIDRLRTGAHAAFLAPAEVAGRLLAGLTDYGRGCDLEVGSVSEVTSARFDFSVEIFSETAAAEVRLALVETPPDGVEVADYKERVQRDASARGAELYTPAHSYAFHASGRVHGNLPGVLEVHRRARNLAFVKAGEIRLETAPAALRP